MSQEIASNIDELLNRARGGDKSAENELFQRLLVRFRLFARQKVGEEDAAEEVAQRACTTVLEKYRTERYSVGFEAWAYGVLKMCIKNYYFTLSSRKEKTIRAPYKESRLDKAAPQIDPDTEMQLLTCLTKVFAVNRRYARVLNLVYQGYRTDEICQRLEMTRNNFYVTLNRARSLLWTCLEGREE